MKQPKHPHTKAQHAASAQWAKAGRASQAASRAAAIAKTGKPPARSKSQHQAALRWAAAGRSSQARSRAHLKPLPKKQPALALGTIGLACQQGWPVAVLEAGTVCSSRRVPAERAEIGDCGFESRPAIPGLHDLPVCAAVAVAEHLLAATGIYASDADILELAARAPGGCLDDYLAEAAAGGLAGARLSGFWQCDPGLFLTGLLYGVQFRQGYHAVLAHPSGMMVSWGMLMPVTGVPCEAWQLEWEPRLS